MGNRLLRNLSFASRPQPAAQERTEPRLLPADPPLPFRRPAPADPGVLSVARDNARASATAPIMPVPDPRPVAPLQEAPGSLRSIALAGSVLFAVAGIGSAAFLLFVNPGREAASSASPAHPATPPIKETAGPGPAGRAEPHPAAPAVAPNPPSTLPQPANDAALQSPSGLPLASPPAAQNPQPAAAEVRTTPPSRRSLPAEPVVADRPADAPTDIPADRAITAPRPTHRVSRARPAERRAHSRIARETRTSSAEAGPERAATPQRLVKSTRRAGASAPQPADQAAAFDELLTRLTGSAAPAGRPSKQVLTPPAAGAADPFAWR